MDRSKSLSVCRLALCLWLAAGAAGAAPWAAVAPPFGSVGQLAVEPRSGQVFAATEASGLYRSNDHGLTWSAVRGFGAARAEILRAAPGAVYAVAGARLFRSTDGGTRWTQQAEPVFDLAVAPSAGNRLYATGAGAQLARSDDGGTTWHPLGNLAELGIFTLGSLAVDPGNPDFVYRLSERGLVVSRDGGAHWTVTGALTDSLYYHELAIDPANPAILYVLASGSLLQSRDGGAHWQAIGASFPRDGAVAAVIPSAGPDPRVYAAVLRSSDGFHTVSGAVVYGSDDQGGHWRQLVRTAAVRTLAVDPARPRQVYLGTTGQVLWSADAGRAWAEGRGVRDLAVRDAALAPHAAGSLYLLSGLGLQKSLDGGRSWASLGEGSALEVRSASRVIADPRTPETVYVVAADAGNGHATSLFKSTDGGGSWQARPLPPLSLLDLAIDPQRPSHLIAAGYTTTTVCGGTDCVFPPHAKAYDSRDGGATWSPVPGAFEPAGTSSVLSGVRFDPADSRRIFLLGDRSFKSGDGGATWSALGLGVSSKLKDLAVDAVHPEVLYGAAAAGLLKSTDGGRHWQPVAGLAGPVERVAVDRRTGAVYAATFDRGVWVSSDGGGRWALVGSGLPGLPATFLIADPAVPGRLWAGLPGFGGLYSNPGR